jgi:cobalt-zinc-cadmium efflux system membrane fusion protein
MKSVKSYLLVGVAVSALLGFAAWKGGIFPPTYAAEHGDDHGHEEGEEKHDDNEKKHGHEHEDKHGHEGEHEEGSLSLTEEQIKAAGIVIISVHSGNLAHEVKVSGKITAAADRMAQIVPKVAGVVIEARKNLGDQVEKGEILALIESKEMAEAASEYLAAKRSLELTQTTYRRERTLWEKKVTAEQDYLNAKNLYQEAQIKLDLSQQKLRTLGHDETAFKTLGTGAAETLRFHELKTPFAGRVIARELTLGEFVDASHSAYTIADLSVVWVETAISPADLPFVKEGQEAVITGSSEQAAGKLIFVSPVIDPETRAAKAIIELKNDDGRWRPGTFANAAIETDTQQAGFIVPKDAIQTVEGKPVVFIKIAEGFQKREVTLGREDSRSLEITSGLNAGDMIASKNTFVLKAEAGKSEAEHAH